MQKRNTDLQNPQAEKNAHFKQKDFQEDCNRKLGKFCQPIGKITLVFAGKNNFISCR